MLSHIVDILADPNDGTALSGADDFSRLVSESGHSFDVAKQGYVTLATGAGLKHKGDDMDMVNARETYLAMGHFAPFVEAVTGAVQDALDSACRHRLLPGAYSGLHRGGPRRRPRHFPARREALG